MNGCTLPGTHCPFAAPQRDLVFLNNIHPSPPRNVYLPQASNRPNKEVQQLPNPSNLCGCHEKWHLGGIWRTAMQSLGSVHVLIPWQLD